MRFIAFVTGVLLLLPCVVLAQQLPPCTPTAVQPNTSADVAFVATLLGNVLARPERAVTEEDRVLIRVLATPEVAQLLSVHRTSSARSVGDLRIIGATSQALTQTEFNLAKAAAANPTCHLDASVDDFAPGLGKVEIRFASVTNSEVKRVTLAEVDFNVEPVYAGMISLGPVVTDLEDPSFGVATNADGNAYVSRTESGEDRIMYALIYTPFIAGKRVAEPALSRDLRSWLRRVNPMFGVVLNDIGKNALGGVSVDLPFGIIAHGGWHVGRTSAIDSASGLTEGSTIAADAKVPVVRKWDAAPFWGISLDMRVALKLLGVAGQTRLP